MSEGFPYGEVGEELVEEVLRCEDARRRGRLLGYLRLATFEEVVGLRETVELLLEGFVGGGERREEDRAALWHCLEIAKRNGMDVGGVAEGNRLMVHEKTGLAMVRVPGGVVRQRHFLGEAEVDVADFWLGKHAVTRWDWARYLGDGGDEPRYWEDGRFHGWHRPVVGVSWEDAMGYCGWGRQRLPSEAQWVWVAGGSQEGGSSLDGGEGRLDEHEWIGEGWSGFGLGPHGVGLLQPGRHGVFDLLGNVLEWREDCFNGVDYIRESRGGSWYNGEEFYLRFPGRGLVRPSDQLDYCGFRVMVEVGGGG